MKRMTYLTLLILTLLVASNFHATPTHAQDEKEAAVHVRVWNLSDEEFSAIQLGTDDNALNFEAIPAGALSEYQTLSSSEATHTILSANHADTRYQSHITLPTASGYYTYLIDSNSHTQRLTVETLQAVVNIDLVGGLCVYGQCQNTITLYSDGTYAQLLGNGDKIVGFAESSLQNELEQAILDADFAQIRSVPFTGTCPIAYDGNELIYSFYTDAGTETLSSCEFELDPAAPLFSTIESIITAQYAE